MADSRDLATAAPAVAESMADHSKSVKQRQALERSARRPVADRKAPPVAADTKRAVAKGRESMPKAAPAEITAFLKRVGLTNRQAADALGLSPSLLSTVQRETGDRWSAKRWSEAQPLLIAAAKKVAAKAK